MKRQVKLYVHIENDMLRAFILPAARRRNPIARPPVLTERQIEMWNVMTRDASTSGFDIEHAVGAPRTSDALVEEMRERLVSSGWGKVDTFKCLELDGCWRVITTIEETKDTTPP